MGDRESPEDIDWRSESVKEHSGDQSQRTEDIKIGPKERYENIKEARAIAAEKFDENGGYLGIDFEPDLDVDRFKEGATSVIENEQSGYTQQEKNCGITVERVSISERTGYLTINFWTTFYPPEEQTRGMVSDMSPIIGPQEYWTLLRDLNESCAEFSDEILSVFQSSENLYGVSGFEHVRDWDFQATAQIRE